MNDTKGSQEDCLIGKWVLWKTCGTVHTGQGCRMFVNLEGPRHMRLRGVKVLTCTLSITLDFKMPRSASLFTWNNISLEGFSEPAPGG